MDDRFTKFSKLYFLIFLLFLSIPVFIGLLIVVFYGISRVISSSYIDILYGLCLVTLPPAVFSSAYLIFFRRTKMHPVSGVRIISRILFAIGIAICAAVLVLDMISFFAKFSIDIGGYYGFSLTFMAGNVATLFLIAIVQALTTSKEIDWMERNK